MKMMCASSKHTVAPLFLEMEMCVCFHSGETRGSLFQFGKIGYTEQLRSSMTVATGEETVVVYCCLDCNYGQFNCTSFVKWHFNHCETPEHVSGFDSVTRV